MLKEVLIVEGKMDTAAVRRALDAETIETGGFALSPNTLRQIAAAYDKRGIIILTDPDGAGERIRKFLTERFPKAGQAFVPKKDARTENDVGIEQASPEAIRLAIAKVRHTEFTPENIFSVEDMNGAELAGTPRASQRRAKLGAALGIGFGNAKRFLQRLNTYGVTRQEFFAALENLDDDE